MCFTLAKIKHLVLLFLLLLSLAVQGQQRLSFKHFRITDGLSQSTVNCMLEDAHNQLWFGTQEGLNRFDGFSFENFNRENDEGIKNAFIYCAVKDKNNNLWFGTRNGILKYSFNHEIFSSFVPPGKSAIAFKKIANLSSNKLLLLTTKNELLTFNKSTNRFDKINVTFPVKSLLQAENQVFIVGENGIYTATNEGEISLWHKERFSIDNVFYCNGALFAVTNSQMNKINLVSKAQSLVFSELRSLNVENITAMAYAKGTYFIATNQQGLITITNRSEVQYMADLFQSDALNSSNLNTIYISNDGILWLGSDRGVSCATLTKSTVQSLGPSSIRNQGLPCENVWSFAAYNQGILIGTEVGITYYNQRNETTTHFARKDIKALTKTDASVMDIESYDGINYLIAAYDGIFLFNPITGSFLNVPIKNNRLKLKHTHFYELFKRNENVIIGTSNGLLRLNTLTKEFYEISVPFRDQVRKITRDSNGDVWVLFENKGLFKCQTSGDTFRLTPFVHNKIIVGLTNDPLTSFVEFNKDEFLIGTMGAGIIRINRKNGTHSLITKKEGLPNNTINSLINDKQGNTWISTNRGIVYLNPAGKVNSMFDYKGLSQNEFNMNSAYLDPKGNLFFGGIFGLVYFDPSIVKKTKTALFPIITKVSFHKKITRYPKGFINEAKLKHLAYEIQLPYNARDFEVRFQPNQLYGASNVSYKYVIIGEETDTIFVGKTNRLSFSSLAAGTYYLRLYARYENGAWTDTPALLTVIINPPFWATVPFWICIGIVVLVSIYFYAKYQINRERKQRIKLEELVTTRTHEIQAQKNQIQRKNELISIEKEKVLEQQKQLFIEKERAEKWLNNALPSQAVKELKVQGKVPAKAYDSATILFTDVVGFSKISESITPTRLVNKLDILFRKFDQIIKDNNLEKIKTIGDAYMAVGGLPDENSTHAIDACIAGLQIQHYMQAKKFDALANHKDYWEIRLGINTGPVTAGIIGTLKMAYDVWGSAVNQAQRMEMLGQPGGVTISEETFKWIEPYFECIHKGKAQMKSKVLLDMYEVIRIKPELSVNNEGLKPNDLFYEIVGLHLYSSIKYYTAEDEVIQLLEKELPKDLTYHSLEHTKEVVKAVERIALLEGVRDEGLFLLKSAALFHDAGFIKQYDHNEPIGAAMAEQMLPKYGYNEQHIKTIKELIHVTQIPHKPVNKLQEIICDADLDYLGTDAFDEIAERLKIELKAKGKIQTDKEWDEVQVAFLKQHKYFTQTAILSREKKKKEHLKRIKQRIERNEY